MISHSSGNNMQHNSTSVTFIYYNGGNHGMCVALVTDILDVSSKKEYEIMGLRIYKKFLEDVEGDVVSFSTQLPYQGESSRCIFSFSMPKLDRPPRQISRTHIRSIISEQKKVLNAPNYPSGLIRQFHLTNVVTMVTNVSIAKLIPVPSQDRKKKMVRKMITVLKINQVLRGMILRARFIKMVKKIILMNKVVCAIKSKYFNSVKERKTVKLMRFDLPLDCSMVKYGPIWLENDLTKSRLLQEFITDYYKPIKINSYIFNGKKLDILFMRPLKNRVDTHRFILVRLYLWSLHLDRLDTIPEDVFKIILSYSEGDPDESFYLN